MSNALTIPITKAGKNIGFTEEEFEALPKEAYHAIIAEGLKVFLNKGMSKITGLKDMDEEELEEAREAAYQIGLANKAALLEGKLKRSRSATGAKLSREETTFINNAAKALIKAAYKSAGKKLPAKASAITQAAKDFVADEDNAEWLGGVRKEFAELKSKTKPIEVGALGAKLKAMLDAAENVKPRVPPAKKAKAEGATVPGAVAAAKGKKGKAQEARAH